MAEPVTLRMQRDTFPSGPQGWLFLAEDRDYLRDAGARIAFVARDAAAHTVPRMADGGAELGFGDLNALIEHATAAMLPPDTALLRTLARGPVRA